MKKLAILLALFPLAASPAVDIYRLNMTLYVPRVYDNTSSLGYRKYQVQRLEGELRVPRQEGTEPAVSVVHLKNRTHKVGTEYVSYQVSVGNVAWHAVGDNAKNTFKTVSVRFDLDANPSYNIGADEPDNTLLITLSGSGNSYKLLRGFVSGQIGCGCMAYGHVSPTRLLYDTYTVVDIASVWGKWTAKLIRTEYD